MNSKEYIEEINAWSANNYHPLDVVISRGRGVWVWDVEGKRYLDMLAAYSALNQGHCHPKIMNALIEQAKELALTSRAFHNDVMGRFLKKLCELTGYQKALPMNSGTEAVETALKISRKWGYLKKGIPGNRGEIIACENNFAGRTISVISFSTEEQYREGFGPFTPGFKIIPFNDSKALEDSITENTAAFIVEPIQGEGGIIIPDEGYLREVRQITEKSNVLLILDEIQTGLGRTGELFAHYYEKIRPDILVVGKALSGGYYPVSAVLTDDRIMDVITPGDHGSTFGGNPLGSAISIAALDVIVEEELPKRSKENGKYFLDLLKTIGHPAIKEVRGKGLFIGIEINPAYGTARKYTEKLKDLGILCKDTHEQVIRFAPPLIIKKEELDFAFDKIKDVFGED